MDTLINDWKKKAAQTAASAAELELAFMDLAYGFISQKAGAFLQDPYRLGFEVVYSNEDNSKMAGMFAFRVGSQLFSVPCFFITGEVKGTELLYQHGVKMFCPLTTKWSEHLISKHEKSVEGSDYPKAMTNKMTHGMQLERLANPFHHKIASAESKSAWEELFEEMDKSASCLTEITTPGLLRDFLVKEDGAMTKLAKAIELSFPFAEAVAHLPEEVWAPSLTEDEANEMKKSASAAFECDFVLLKDGFNHIKNAAEGETYRAHKRGWTLLDARKEMEPKTRCVATEEDLTEISSVGFYEVLCTDLEYRKAFVGIDAHSCGSYDYNSIGSRTTKNLQKTLIFLDGDLYKEFGSNDIVGNHCDDTSAQWEHCEELMELPTKGGNVFVDTSTGEVSTPFHVNKIETREDGVTILMVQRMYSHQVEQWLINKDYHRLEWSRYGGSNETTVLHAPIKFLKVALETRKKDECCDSDSYGSHGTVVGKTDRSYTTKDCPHVPGNTETFWMYLMNAGAKKVSLSLNEETVTNTYDVNINGVESSVTDPAVLTVKLASQLGIHVTEALDIVDEVTEKGKLSFIAFGEKEHVKVAASIRILDSPNFTQDFDSDLGVARDHTQQFVLNSETTQPIPPSSRYGDGYDPTGGNKGGMITSAAREAGFDDSMLFSKSPEELSQMAQQGGVASLVDPGIVGMLLSTYNSAAMVVKYLPKLLEGLDHFGRLLFLFRWKPADFEKLYGSDDMSNLEDNLVSQFLSQGDIVLELIQRSSDAGSSAPM
jgi:hypothetical protein